VIDRVEQSVTGEFAVASGEVGDRPQEVWVCGVEQ
jgi:hypothetical protein